MIPTGSSLALDTTSQNRPTIVGNSNQPRTSSATSVASLPTRRTNMRQLSGHILSTLLRQSESVAVEPAFPAETQRATMSGTTQDIPTMLPLITVAHTSTSLSSGEPQTSESTHTCQGLAAEEGEHRSPIQTTVDDLGELVERFRGLNFEGRDEFFQRIVTEILPVTRTRSNAVGRRGSTAGMPSPQIGMETQQNAGRNQDAVVDAAAT